MQGKKRLRFACYSCQHNILTPHRWSQNYIDVNNLVRKLLDAERSNRKLREEVARLRSKTEEGEECDNTVDRLKECCEHLQNEIDRRTRQSQNRYLERGKIRQ